MSDLVLVVVGSALALLLWRLLKSPRDPARHLALAVSDVGSDGLGGAGGSGLLPPDVHHWQPLGRFDFEIIDTERHQAVLRAALNALGAQCTATLHASKEVGAPVEVRVSEHRVGFLSDGDATRFQRRLAFEARPGQTSQCGARIVAPSEASRQTYAILLDLKPFRH